MVFEWRTVTCDEPFGVLASILFYYRQVHSTYELTIYSRLLFSLIKLPKNEKGKIHRG